MKRAIPIRCIAAAALALGAISAQAGGPLSICSTGVPIKYSGSGSVALNYDQGALGARTKSQADAIVNAAIATLSGVPTATVSVTRSGDLPVDVTTANYTTYFQQFTDGVNPVIYDTDGSITSLLLGVGARSQVLGFAGSAWYDAPSCTFVEGQAVINGYVAVFDATMTVVLTHELGHLIGLDHTQLDNVQGLAQSNFPLMYPVAYRTTPTLHEDDAAALSALYPAGAGAVSPKVPLNNVYGTLSGAFTTAGGTPILGANIWAQGTGGTFSSVSDYLTQGTGAFRMLVPPGTYTLHAEAIDSSFTGGSSVGPYSETSSDASFQPPLYSGATPMAPVTLGNGTPVQVAITAGCTATGTFRIDGLGTLAGCVTLPATPTTVSPTGTITTATPTYIWNAVAGAASYNLLVQNGAGVAVSRNFTATAAGCSSGAGTCSATPTNALANATAYSWFVNAVNGAGTTAWSAPRAINVSLATVPAAPTTISPSGAITTTTPMYTWNASAGATSYGLLVQNTVGTAVNQSFTATAAGCGAGAGTCTVTATNALANGSSYNWFVNATNSAGTSAWSAGRGISVSVAGPIVPAAPTTVTPNGTIATITPAYSWNASTGATSYYLLVQNTAGVAVSLSYTATAAGCAAGTGTCTVTPTTALTNGSSYNWFVNASNSAGTSAWSAARAISVSGAAGPSVPSAPTLVSPSGSVTTATPAYTWNASSGATSYYLLVQNTAGVAVSLSYSATAAGCAAGTGTCSVTPTNALTSGASYNWFVNASNSLGTSAWSAPLGISVTVAGPSVPSAPTLVSPSGTVTTTTPTYTWNASAGATSYYLLAQNTAGVAVSLSYTAAAAGCAAGTGTCSVTPTNALTSGSVYNWFVNASNSLGTSAWSAASAITVSAAGPSVPSAPTLVTPNGTLLTATPTYMWNASAGATSYYLLVQNTFGVAIGVSYSAAAVGCSAGTGTCSVTPSGLMGATTYVWFVNATNSLGTSAWSAGNTITTP